jgi:2-dehydropantoate 2-reductase
MPKIAIIGPGAIGATVAVLLAEGGRHDLTICARSPVARLVIDREEGQAIAEPLIITSVGQGKPCDWVLVATKAYDVASAATWFETLVDSRTRIAVLQNGVEHVERFSPYVAADRIVPVVVDIPVERVAPGHFRQRRAGSLRVAAGGNGDAFVDLFLGCNIDAATTPDFRSAMWRKLAINCAGVVSALTLQPAKISRNPDVADIMRALVRECVAVAQAEGAVLDERLPDMVVESYQGNAPDAVNSLHGDRIAGRSIEVDARNGVIVRLGRKHNIDAPVNHMMTTLLKVAAGG